jgi:predicted dehydrogenase
MAQTEKNRIRAGVIGVGKMGGFHLAKLLQNPRCEVVGIFDPDLDRAHVLAAEKGVKAFSNLGELLFEIDAAIIASPTDFHFSVAREAMAAGVHVLVEKPLAPTSQQAKELVEMAEKQKLVLTVGHLERFRLQHFLNELGLRDFSGFNFIEADRLHSQGGREEERIDVISDLMIHDLDLVLSLAAQLPTGLSAIGMQVLTRHSDIANARLEFPDGAIANINASRVSTHVQRKFRIFGKNQYVSMDFLNQRAVLVERAESGLIQQRSIETTVDCLEKQTEQFLNCIATRQAPLVTGRQALDALVWMERIQEQILQRRQLLQSDAQKPKAENVNFEGTTQWQPKFS